MRPAVSRLAGLWLASALMLAAPSAVMPQDAVRDGSPAPANGGAAPAAPAAQDTAFGAYQQGLYLTAFHEATRRLADDPNDAAAMTLLGELYSRGFGVAQNWEKAADWYRLAALRGDPQAAYALGMIKLQGQGASRDPAEARKLLESAAEAVPGAAYNLGLLLLREGTPASDQRAAGLFRRAAEARDADAEYALAVLLRDGRGVEKDQTEAALWMGRAARDRHISAQVEYGIMLFNGDGLRKDETAGAKMFVRAAEQGNPVAQNRLARIYATGRGLPRNVAEAVKWHIISTSQGIKDPWLDETLKGISPADRQKGEEAASKWVGG